MRIEHLLLSATMVLLTFGGDPEIPTAWMLGQNQPDPFCSAPGGGGTEVRFDLPQKCRVSFNVWDEGMTSVVRSLIAEEWREAGRHALRWDGLGNGGEPVVDGAYPYTLVTRDSLEQVLFADTLISHVSCGVETRPTSWGSIKAGVPGESH